MWVMAIGADYLAFPDRVAGAPVHLGAFVLMALKTHLRLRSPGQDRVIHCHDVMAVGAGVVRQGMIAHLPVDLDPVLMALGTDGRLLLRRQSAGLGKGHHQWRFLARCIQVLAHGTMAGFTATVRQGPAHLGHGEGAHVFFMAFHALGAAVDEGGTLNRGVKGRPVDVSAGSDTAVKQQGRGNKQR